MKLVWVRYLPGVAQRRETHLVPSDGEGNSDERVVALCGQPFKTWQVEHPGELGDLACVQCQLLSPEPDWATLERVPYPPRLPFANSGP